MTAGKAHILSLAELAPGQEGDFFAQMYLKEELLTRDHKPYFKVGFRDARREVAFPVWGDSDWADDCRDVWRPGEFYKLRATLIETKYGPQLEIHKIRPAIDDDAADGFEPENLVPGPKVHAEELFDRVLEMIAKSVGDGPLQATLKRIYQQHRATLLQLPAATRHHHAYPGGFLEHTLRVAETCAYLAAKYAEAYDGMTPPLDPDLVIAGGLLHDIGKLRELDCVGDAAVYSPAGELIGHIQLGRDLLREAAAETGLDAERLLRLEHIIVSHQRLPEAGSPKPPMTPEALLVHYADECDVKFDMATQALGEESISGSFTSSRNPLRHKIFRGLPER